jgi:hypothetical protein
MAVIKVKKDFEYFENGCHMRKFKKGEEYEVKEETAVYVERNKKLGEVKGAGNAPENKAASTAPENKSAEAESGEG